MRRMPLCERSPWPGQPVIVAVPESTARSHIMSPQLLPADIRAKFPTVIRDVATTGNSGSGVFDAGIKCLPGVMSRKLVQRLKGADAGNEAKYFVPAATIRTFILGTVQRPAVIVTPPTSTAFSGLQGGPSSFRTVGLDHFVLQWTSGTSERFGKEQFSVSSDDDASVRS
jgi:hypothetical protein